MDLWTTVVGSHMWEHETPTSDKDIFTCYSMSKRDFLLGTKPNNTFEKNGNEDIIRHEIFNVVNQLKKMNVNYVWYLTSPIVEKSSGWHHKLLKIFHENPAKNIMLSIKGMIINNNKKYPNPSEKKIRTWLRTAKMGIRYIESGRIDYKLKHLDYITDINQAINTLIDVYKISDMPEYPDPEPYNDFLYDIREALVIGRI